MNKRLLLPLLLGLCISATAQPERIYLPNPVAERYAASVDLGATGAVQYGHFEHELEYPQSDTTPLPDTLIFRTQVPGLDLSTLPKPYELIVVDREPISTNMDDVKRQIQYPPDMFEKRLEGKVIVRMLVGPDGAPIRALFTKFPHPSFAREVARLLPQLRFKSAQAKGVAVAAWTTIPFEFRIMR